MNQNGNWRNKLGAVSIVLLLMLAPLQSNARSLQDMFNQLGGFSNVTGPNAVQGQVSNYYTGGSVSTRNPIVQASLFNLSAPSVKGGCGGIDMYMGGFSYINGQQIVALLRAAAANLGSELFFLALDTFVPVVSAVIKKLQAMAQESLANVSNSCAVANSVLQATGVKDSLVNAKQTMYGWASTTFNLDSDAYAAKDSSSDDGKVSGATAQMLANPATKDQPPAGNVVWRAIWDKQFLDATPQQDYLYKRLIMSLVGTIIFPVNSTGVMQPVAPQTIDLADLVGSQASSIATAFLYDCDDGGLGGEMGCMQMVGPIAENLGPSFRQQTIDRLNAIITNMRNNIPPSTQDMDFIGNSPLPLYKVLALVASDPSAPTTILNDVADILSIDYAYTYLKELYGNIERSIAGRIPEVDATTAKQLEAIQDQKKFLLAQLERMKEAAQSRAQNIIKMADALRSYDQVMARKVNQNLMNKTFAGMIGN